MYQFFHNQLSGEIKQLINTKYEVGIPKYLRQYILKPEGIIDWYKSVLPRYFFTSSTYQHQNLPVPFCPGYIHVGKYSFCLLQMLHFVY